MISRMFDDDMLLEMRAVALLYSLKRETSEENLEWARGYIRRKDNVPLMYNDRALAMMLALQANFWRKK